MDLEGLLGVSSSAPKPSHPHPHHPHPHQPLQPTGMDRDAALGETERLLAGSASVGVDLAKHPSGIIPVLQYRPSIHPSPLKV